MEIDYRKAKESLSVKRGDTVRVKKGSLITSMHPQRYEPFEAKRSQKVKIHHTDPGGWYNIGNMIISKDAPREKVCFDYDARYCIKQELYGKYRWAERAGMNMSPERFHLLFEDPSRVACYREDYDHGSFFTVRYIYLHTAPNVSWAGSGGYWHSTDINNVEVVAA